MKDYYVYLAEERINSLYSSIKNPGDTKDSFELKADWKSLSGGYSHERNTSDSIHMKLKAILGRIAIGNIFYDDSVYFKGNIQMSWNADNLIDKNINSTFWIGDMDSEKNSYYSYARILLIGSKHNIIGNSKEAGSYYSTSYIDAFFKNLEGNPDFQRFILKEYAKSSNDNLEILFNNNISSEKKELYKKYLMERRKFVYEYIDELYDRYMGNYSEYEFVAQRLSTCLSFNKEEQLVKYIIAAPLYVKKKKVLGSRTLQTSKCKKYVLTSGEYQEHKKNAFISLAKLLISEGLIEEEKKFTAEMRTIYINMGKESIFELPYKKREFIEKVEPIVLKYFYIYDKNDLK